VAHDIAEFNVRLRERVELAEMLIKRAQKWTNVLEGLVRDSQQTLVSNRKVQAERNRRMQLRFA
jgi:hypothetical protein